MTFEKQIRRTIAALMFIAVSILPLVVQFAHIFEGEEHIVCANQTTHLHQDNPDCPICHFHLASYTHDVLDYPDFSMFTSPIRVEKKYASLFHYFYQTNTQLRAPPHFLS